MKIRQGFVSNSSTTSFCIYGAEADGIFHDNDDNGDNDAWSTCEKMGLDYNQDDYSSWVGLEWSSMRDDETGAQFKARVEAKLFKLGITPDQCDTFERAWRDG